MTQTPPRQPPSARPAYQPPPARPVLFMVFGILNIVLGASGMCCMGWQAAGVWLNMLAQGPQANHPVIQYLQQATGYKVFATVTHGLEVVICLGLAFCGVGLLSVRGWARRGSVTLACLFIVTHLVSTIGNIVLYAIPVLDIVPEDDPERRFFVLGLWAGPLFALLTLIYPVVLIVFMSRASAKQATGKPATREV